MDAAATAEVRNALLANPRRINAREAAIRIVSARNSLKRDAAQQWIERIEKTEAVASLFERVMPVEYKETLARCEGSRMTAAHGFVLQLGFPLSDFWNFNQYNDVLHEIPIEPMGFHVCDDCYAFESFKVQYQLGLLMLPSLYEDEVFYSDEEEDEYTQDREANREGNWIHLASKYRLDNKWKPDGLVPHGVLHAVFSASRSPLRFFADLWRFIRHSTGSTFLDFEGDYALEIPWSRQAIIDLRREYALAQRILADLEKLDAWFDQDPVARIHKALRLYAKARKQTNDRPKRSRALVRIL